MRKILSALLCASFILMGTACSQTEDTVSDTFPEDKNEQTVSVENEVKEESETKTEPQTVAFTPDCPTCVPYLYGGKTIILDGEELLLSEVDSADIPTTDVNCFVYTAHNRIVFTDSGVYEFPDQPEYTEIVFTESGMTEIPAEHQLIDSLSEINSTDKILHASPQIFYGDTLDRPGIYVFTEGGKCWFVDKNGSVAENTNVSLIIDENGHTVTLYTDGTVEDSYFSDETELWSDVCFIDTNRTDGYGITVGVKNDGKILIAGEYTGDRAEIEAWTEAVSAVVINDMENYYPIALTKFGTLLFPSDCKLTETVLIWSNIVEIGLTAPDGTFWARTADGEFLFAEQTK